MTLQKNKPSVITNMKWFLLSIFLTLPTFEAYCQIKLPRLISDGMILQRDTELELWGWASAGEELTLHFNDEEFHTRTNEDGEWSIKVPAQEAGGPFEMIFEGRNEIEIQNILFGDVWVASGQSNMELTMERVKEKYPDVIAKANQDEIRQFLVPDRYDFKTEHEDFENGTWNQATPETVLNFSAVAYFFALELYEEYQVPVGIINASLGGSPVEAWMSEETLKQFPDAYNELQRFKDDSLISRIENADQQRIFEWYSQLNAKDEGLQAEPNWYQPEVDDSNWDEIQIPGYWTKETIGDFNGSVWFRREITIPPSMAGKEAFLWFGTIVDQDSLFINGQFAGTTGYQYPPRRYLIDEGVLKEGKNEFAVRVINSAGTGGFIPDKPYFLAVDGDTLDLSGTWKYKVGATMEPLASQTFIRWKPAGLYNRMLAPLTNYQIQGVIWYQGESNTSDPELYNETFPAMIENWRDEWNQGDFPFLYVQLANFMKETEGPEESNWAELRQAQLNSLSVPNTGMAVIIDLGEWNDIHPLNKEDVGKRLALEAKKVAYGETNIPSSPIPAQAEFNEDHVLIHFDNAEKGLMTKNGKKPQYFALSNDGENFTWAKAEIEGSSVKVWSEEIQNPKMVRYAWADNPATANLYNSDGLPATPFEIVK